MLVEHFGVISLKILFFGWSSVCALLTRLIYDLTQHTLLCNKQNSCKLAQNHMKTDDLHLDFFQRKTNVFY
jgi:hypothetical protein